MEDIAGKLTDLLSDEESVRQLSELAGMLMNGGEAPAEGSENNSNGLPDMGTIMKLSGLAGSLSQNDKNAGLILALKPHLSPERQKRADKAVKILKLLALWSAAKDSGLLKDIL